MYGGSNPLPTSQAGGLAEWLGRGLQSLVRRFESVTHLPKVRCGPFFLPMKNQPLHIHTALNREGGLFLFFMAGLGGAAIYSGNSGLVLFFCAIFAVIVLAYFVARNNLKNISIERRFVEELFAQKETRIDLIIKNQGNHPVYGLHIYDTFELNRQIGPVFVRQLAPGDTATSRYLCQFPTRGVAQFIGFQVRSRFPLPFFEFRLDIDHHESACVYPAPVPGVDQVFLNPSESLENKTRSYAEEYTIRELVHGRRTGRILWKLSARRQTWLESVPLRHPLPGDHLIINVADKQSLGVERFERQISQITDLVLKRLHHNRTGEVHLNTQIYKYGHSPKERQELLEALAKA